MSIASLEALQRYIDMLLTYNDTAEYLSRSRDGLRKLQLRDPDFPKSIKMGTAKQSAVYFDSKDIDAWIELQKSKTEEA